jgi:hypothetical protein
MFLINVAAYLVIGTILWSVMGSSIAEPNGRGMGWLFVYVIIMLVLLTIAIGEAIRKREKK